MLRVPMVSTALLAVVLAVTPAAAGPDPALTAAPTDFACVFSTTDPNTIECSWSALDGASKYSVDVIANYTLGVGGEGSFDFDFGTPLTTAEAVLPADVDQDTLADTLVSAVLRVKGMNPPGRQAFNQNTPFSSTVTCTVATGVCVAD